MEKDSSPLDTLRQLKEWLDAGTITPQEFETLKKKLLFSDATPERPLPPGPEPTANSEAAVLLPPVVDETLPTDTPATAPASAAGFPPTPIEEIAPPASAGRPTASSSTEPAYPVVPPPPAPPVTSAATPAETSNNSLSLVLIIGGVVALLALIAYLALGNRESERLTSISQTAADTVAVQPEVGPQAEQIELPAPAAPETVRVVPAVPPVVATTDSAATASATALTTPPASAEASPAPSAPTPADENAVRTRVLQALNAYYDDLKAAPFNAAQHFAPTVERFYTLQNVTPAAISEDLTKSHFPEFTEEETQVEPSSLKIGPETEDGTRMVTYLEKSKAFRVSRQQHQQTTAQVRVRLDRDYKITYLRQERLLENTFTD